MILEILDANKKIIAKNYKERLNRYQDVKKTLIRIKSIIFQKGIKRDIKKFIIKYIIYIVSKRLK